MQKLIIDRFVGDYAVCEKEDGTMIDIERYLIPINAVEGSCLIINNDNTISIDEETCKLRKENIKKLMDDLFE